MKTLEELLCESPFKASFQAEKDYVQDIVLKHLYDGKSAKPILKGGTALSKFYGSNRFSGDLDFTLFSASVDSLNYFNHLINDVIKGFDSEYHARIYKVPLVNKYGTASAKLILEGPRFKKYHNSQSMKQQIAFETSFCAQEHYKPRAIYKLLSYSDVGHYSALVLDEREILAQKIRTFTANRMHRERDLYDAYFLLRNNVEIDSDLVLQLIGRMSHTSKKTVFYNIDSARARWSLLRSSVRGELYEFEDARNYVEAALESANIFEL